MGSILGSPYFGKRMMENKTESTIWGLGFNMFKSFGFRVQGTWFRLKMKARP